MGRDPDRASPCGRIPEFGLLSFDLVFGALAVAAIVVVIEGADRLHRAAVGSTSEESTRT